MDDVLEPAAEPAAEPIVTVESVSSENANDGEISLEITEN